MTSKYKDRIAKLLKRASLIKTGAEAEAALLFAQKLMLEHNIEMSEIVLEDDGKSSKKEVVDSFITPHKRTPWWHGSLASVIGENFRCQAYASRGNGGSRIAFIGLKEDVEIATQVFFAALEMADGCLKAYCKVNGYRVPDVKNDYLLGFMNGLKKKFVEQVSKEGWGLMLVKDGEVVEAIQKRGLKNQNRSVGRKGNEDAYGEGFHQGKNFSTNRIGGK